MSRPRIFDYDDYKKYLKQVFDAEGAARSGKRTAFSKALGCQPAYLSRVLNADAQLSLEQVDRASQFLGHAPDEQKYFFFLVLWNRAGTSTLKKKLGEELKEIQERQ